MDTKVILISPAGAERNQQNDIIYDLYQEMEGHLALMMDDIEFIPNLALLSLASYLPSHWKIKFVEEDYLHPDKREEEIFNGGYDLALISIVNYTAIRGYEIARRLKKQGVYTVIGGLHASALPEEASLHCDTLITGEGEEIIQEFIADYTNQSPKAFYKASSPVDLTKTPPARYDLIENPRRYNKMPVTATRGCPHNCDFCCFPALYGRKYRHKNVRQVITDIRNIKKIHPKPYIHFCDENLLCNREFSIELLRSLAEEKVSWECFCDIDIAQHDEILTLLQKSSCKDLLIGLETVDPEVMETIDPWKHEKLSSYKRDIRKIQSYGLPVTGLFILGFDGDDEGVFKRVRDFIISAQLFDMDFAVLTPIPGSALYSRLKKEGRILSEDWNRYTWTHVNFQPMKMTPEELQKGLLWLFREFARMDFLEKRESSPLTQRLNPSHREKI